MKKYILNIIKVIISLLLLLVILFDIYKIFFDRKNTMDEPIDYFAGLNFVDISENKVIGKTEEINNINGNIKYVIKYPIIGDDNIDKIINDKVDKLIENNNKNYLTNSSTIDKYYFLDYKVYISCDTLINVLFNEVIIDNKFNVLNEFSYSYVFDVVSNKELKREDIFKDGYEKIISEYLDYDIGKGYYYVIRNDKLVINDKIDIPFKDIKKYLKINTNVTKCYENGIKENIYSLVNKKYITKSDLNIYSKDDNNSEVLANVEKNKNLNVYKVGDNGYSIVLYDDLVGYVQNDKIQEYREETVDKPSTPPNVDVPKEEIKEELYDVAVTMYVLTDLNVRDNFGTNSSVIGVLNYGDTVQKVGQAGAWAKISYNDGFAYVSNSYLSSTKPKSWTDIGPVAPQGAIDPTKPMVALTFDDGPNNTSTVRILNTLEKYNVRATFFDQGSKMLKYPEISKREATLGEVGTHTYSHANLNALGIQALQSEIQLSKETFFNVMGYEPKLFRAPYGNSNATVKSYVDMPLIYWTIDTLDWQSRNVNAIMKKITAHSSLDGKIVLMHSIHETSADAVEVMIPYLLDCGYQLVTVSELAQYRGYVMQPGTVYYSFYK